MIINRIKYGLPLLMMGTFFSPSGWCIDISDNLKVGASIRERYEYKEDFNFRHSNQSYLLTQLRLNAELQISDALSALVELQHAQINGAKIQEVPSINKRATPNIYADSLDIHRAYIDYAFDGGKLRVGRQKFNFGDLRLVASLEWVNTARVFDAARLTLGDESTRQYDFFVSRFVTVDPRHLNDWAKVNKRYADSDFHGIYAVDKVSLENSEIRAYWFYRHNSELSDNTHTFGVHYLGKCQQVETNIQGAVQVGEYGDKNHTAYMLNLGVDIPISEYKVGFVYNFASGDNGNSDKHKTFDNLYPLNHAYYGYMDLFALQNIHNFQASVKAPFLFGGKLRVAYEEFWLAKKYDSWYNAGLGTVRRADVNMPVSSHVGSELDFTLQYVFCNKKFSVVGGYSHFFTGQYVADTGPSKDANFYFLQAKYSA